MDSKQKSEMVSLISQALHEVMIPALDALGARLESKIAALETKMATKNEIRELLEGQDRIGRKLDAQQDRMDRHGKILDNHGGRIDSLEQKLTH